MSQKLRLAMVFVSSVLVIYMALGLTYAINMGDNTVIALYACGFMAWLTTAITNSVGLYFVRKHYQRLKESESKNA